MNLFQGIAQTVTSAAGALSGLLGRKQEPSPNFEAQLKAMQFGHANEAIAWVEKEFDRRLQQQQPWHLQWRLNVDFLNGLQYRMIDNFTGAIRDIPPIHQWASRRVHNQLLPTEVARRSKLSRARPVLKARPNSGEQRDIATAKTSWKVLAANEAEQDWPRKYTEVLAWLGSCGNVVTKDVWNRQAGRLIGQVEVMQQPTEDGTTPAPQVQAVYEGDVETVVRSPFSILPDSPWRSSIDQCKSVIEANPMSVGDILQTYGVAVKPENLTAMGIQQSIVAPGAPSGNMVGGMTVGTVQLDNHSVVKEYWEMPSSQFPEGRLIVVASKTLLYIGPLPYKCGPNGTYALPYTIWNDVSVPGCLWAKAIVELLIPIQRELNDIYNEKRDYRRRLAHGQVIVEEGSVDMDDVEENAGRHDYIWVIKKGTSFLPRPMEWGDRASVFERDEASLLNEWTLISGISEMARKSEAPAGVKSGVALSIATEQDDTRLAATVENIALSAVSSGKKRLRLYRQFATGQRLARYVGADNQVDALYWESSDLTAEDLFVENSSALAESPAQRRQMVFDMYKEGLFSDPQNGKLTPAGRQKLFEMLQLGNWEDGTDTDALQASKQDREIRLILQGGNPIPDEFDDDMIHLNRIVRYMLSAEWEERMQEPDGQQVYQALVAHREAHLQKLVMDMQAQAPPMAPGAPMQ